MKTSSSLFIAILLFFSLEIFAQKRTVVCGKILNTNDTEITIGVSKNTIEEGTDIKTPIGKNKTFKFVFMATEPKLMALKCEGKYIAPFVEPGDSIVINTDTKDFYGKLKFSGRSKNIKAFTDPNYEKIFSLRDGAFYSKLYPKLSSFTIPELKLFCDSSLASSLEYLKTQKELMSDAFYNYCYNIIYYSIQSAKLSIPKMKLYSQMKPGEKTPISYTAYLSYYTFLDSISTNHDDLINDKSFNQFLTSVVMTKAELLTNSLTATQEYSGNSDFFDQLLLYYNITPQLFTGKVSDQVLTTFFSYALSEGTKSQREDIYRLYQNQISDTSYLAIAARLYHKNKNRPDPPVVGNTFPPFVLKDINGKEISLASLKGKVVYVDFWATWCGPCRADMPESKKLKEKYKDKDVVFINISIDVNEKKWKDFVAKENLSGVNINTVDKAVLENYGIRGIPSYFLLDKEGKIISKSRPTEEVTEKLIVEALK